ncbi:1,4-dihydroxy-2-naphthoate octaprenyltransferase [Thermosipho atlanticus]|uniref:1,4-dihydroxy-2-naphthoate octaprenyltransferase n=1 Tax=Thermosipho atlanticus DSM 15807 TaxID=1123380 RepID=A0A1M5S4U8_9BACT|nr:1,4-dihydroxy-2-naphthoate octaprenyltransferase [Thermosipho atlanticus]SHH33460.1 1,4-dihydroxy-2-naphthoate prenyltransferase [Thermosipho atlanticus DSM 15807]
MKKILIAVRPFSFIASFLPVTAGALLAGKFNFSLYIISLFSAILIQAGVNTTNDYFDYMKGVDDKESLGSSGLLIHGKATPQEIISISIVCYILAVVLGLYLVKKVGSGLIWYGVIGIIFGYFYTGKPLQLKYKAFGMFQVFILMGPLMVLGSYYVQTQKFSYKALLLSIPIGIFTDLILHANDIRDSQYDKKAGIKTLAILIGDKNATYLYIFLTIIAYFFLTILYFLKVFTPFIFLSVAVLPIYFKVYKLIKEKSEKKKAPHEVANVDKMTALAQIIITGIVVISMMR